MKILHCLAQLPMKTGSGIYYDTVINHLAERGHENAALYGVQEPFSVELSCVASFPVRFNTETLPFPIAGMSDEMPYPSTVYSEMTKNRSGNIYPFFAVAWKRRAAPLNRMSSLRTISFL